MPLSNAIERGTKVRIILSPLSHKEMLFCLELLNSAKAETKVTGRRPPFVSVSESQSFETVSDRLRRTYERGKVSAALRPRGWYFGKNAKERFPINAWSFARLPLVSAVLDFRKQPASFVYLPPIAVPMHYPPVMINEPLDLVNWLVARGMANRQLKRFVKCAREECEKFGMRRRGKSDARFCSEDCQRIFNAESRKLKSAGVFGSLAIGML
jgi:hypothetical protein